MKTKLHAAFFSIATLVIIGITFYFLVQKNFTSQQVNESVFVPSTNTSTTTASNEGTQFQSSSTISHAPSVVEKKEELKNGVIREIRNEVPVKEWKHSTGTTVTLYEKDYYYDERYDEPIKQTILKIRLKNGDEQGLFNNVSEDGELLKATFIDLRYSPLGTYLVVRVGGNESSSFLTYTLKDLAQVYPSSRDERDRYLGMPYWNADESKLVVLNSASGIEGISAAMYYSPTGNFSNLKTLTPQNDNFKDNAIYDPIVIGNKLSAKTFLQEKAIEGTLVVDMDTGTYIAIPEIEW